MESNRVLISVEVTLSENAQLNSLLEGKPVPQTIMLTSTRIEDVRNAMSLPAFGTIYETENRSMYGILKAKKIYSLYHPDKESGCLVVKLPRSRPIIEISANLSEEEALRKKLPRDHKNKVWGCGPEGGSYTHVPCHLDKAPKTVAETIELIKQKLLDMDKAQGITTAGIMSTGPYR